MGQIFSSFNTKPPKPHLHRYYFIFMFGASGVGQKSLIDKYATTTDNERHQSSLDNSYYMKDKNISYNDKMITIRISKNKNVLYTKLCNENYYGVIIMYDVTNRESFNTAQLQYRQLLNKLHHKIDIPILLLANKTDLIENREVSTMEGVQFASENHLQFSEISVAKNENIDETFTYFLEALDSNTRYDPMYCNECNSWHRKGLTICRPLCLNCA
jgi:Ras-related protein Rab-2A